MILSKDQVDKETAQLFNDFEKGDYLLDWDKSGLPRYCHNFSDEEVDKLVGEFKLAGALKLASLEVVSDFNADGKEGNLNRYVIFKKS